MRERLVVTMVAMTVGVIVLFGAAHAYSTADLVHDEELTAVADSADLIASAVAALGDAPVTESFLSELTRADQTITWVAGDGTTVSTRAAARDTDDISASRPVAGSAGGRVILTQAASVSSDRVSAELLPLVLVALALSILAAVIGWLLAQRFARPFHQLAADATRIGDGHFDVDVHHSSIREAAELGNALRRAAGQLDALVRRERELAVVASHELRTPITALRLSLEDLTMWPQTPADVAEELHHSLAEVDRLSGVVTTLLERGDGKHLGEAVDIDLREIATDAAERWDARARAYGRRVVLGRFEPALVRAVPAPVEHVVDILIENALVHGVGTVTVGTQAVDNNLRFQVDDEGARVIDPGVVHISPAGPGASLTDAATKAGSLGGFVMVNDTPTTRIALVLPRPDSD
nr:hypothetical protein [Aeromicrobium sp.]